MDEYNFNLPSREFMENNFKRLFAELALLKKLLSEAKCPQQKFYRNKDLKKVFGLSDNTIYDYRERGLIPCKKLGGIYYYPVDDLNRFMDNNSNFGKL